MGKITNITFCVWATLVSLGPAAFAAPPPQLSLETVATGLNRALLLTHAPGDDSRLFVVQQIGQISIIQEGSVLPTPFLYIRERISYSGEQGLLGLAFHPDYALNGLFFVYYTDPAGDTHLSRFSVSADPNVADPSSEVVLLTYDQPFANHNGGMLAFGPNDGYLYVALGDGGGGNDPNQNAQNLDSLLGKILRIDINEGGEGAGTGGPDYDIPPSNPFVGTPGARGEVWAYGLRNPWRFSFDRNTGDLWIGDVGQNAQEELDFQPGSSAGGENYGWRVFEGDRCNTTVTTQPACDALAPQAVFPVHTYANPADGRAITCGYVYRGKAMPGLQGTMFFADFSSARVWSFRYPNQVVSEFQELTSTLDPAGTQLELLASFGEDAAGELYLLNLSGTVMKFVDAAAAPCSSMLTGPCPALQAEGAAAYAGQGLDWPTADVDGNLIPDRWETLVMEYILCAGTHPLSDEAACAYETNLTVLSTEPSYTALASHEHVYAALLSISGGLQEGLRGVLGLEGTYRVVELDATARSLSAPLGALGDLDGDGLTNGEEAANALAAGLRGEDFAEAALNPLLDGSQTAPVALPVGLGAAAGSAALLLGVFFLVFRKRSWRVIRRD